MEQPCPTSSEARRSPEDPTLDDGAWREIFTDDGERTGGGRIRCPRCGWRPRASDRWMCTCGHAWNTFDTRGRCPGCGRQWRDTQCLACHAWSPHEAWYDESRQG